MGDMGDVGNAMRAHRQDRHAQWKADNLARLRRVAAGRFSERPEALLFREKHKPAVDFYPSTGRWRQPNGTRTHRGGAVAFWNWYLNQGAP